MGQWKDYTCELQIILLRNLILQHVTRDVARWQPSYDEWQIVRIVHNHFAAGFEFVFVAQGVGRDSRKHAGDDHVCECLREHFEFIPVNLCQVFERRYVLIHLERAQMKQRVVTNIFVRRTLLGGGPHQARRLCVAAMLGHARGQSS